jgi:thioredoxin 1
VQPTGEDSVVSLGDGDIQVVVEADGVTLVEFYTEWCGACQRMQPVLERIADDTDATVLTVDIESRLETAIEFGAQGTPTFVLFVDGEPVKRLRGAQTEQSLRDFISRYST